MTRLVPPPSRHTVAPRPTALLVWGRAFVLALVALVCGSVSHAAAGGRLPSPAVLLGLLVWGTALAGPLTLRRLPRAAVVALVVSGQAVCHLALSALAGHRGEPPPGTGTGLVAHLWEHLTEQGPLMLLGHLLAAAAVGLWLSQGEYAAWALVSLAATRPVVAAAWRAVVLALRAVLPGLAEAARRVGRPGLIPVLAAHPAPVLRPLVRRGPPVLLAS